MPERRYKLETAVRVCSSKTSLPQCKKNAQKYNAQTPYVGCPLRDFQSVFRAMPNVYMKQPVLQLVNGLLHRARIRNNLAATH